jgi:D-alanyl-D-alanine carboxypeptidase
LVFVPRWIRGAVLTIAVAAAPLSATAKTVDDQSPYIVVDVESGMVLADRQADQPWYPASLTKLMTAYVTFRAMAEGRVSADTRVVESETAAAQAPVKMGFPVGTRISLDNALKMMLVPSANDIAVAIAEGVGGSLAGFVDVMNAEAARLGMSRTRFENPHGLPAPEQVSTARDLALLARNIWLGFPEQRHLFGIQAISSGKSVYHSPNLMLLERYRGASGMKTGFTCDAGYNLAAVATRDGRTVLAVVLGRTSSSDRAELTARLFNEAFSQAVDPEAATELVAFADPESDAGPVEMNICTGSGVDRVGFSRSVLGPVVAVSEPVKVVTDTPEKPPAKPAAKPAAKSTKPASTAAAKPAPKGATATAAAAKGSAAAATGKTTTTASVAKGSATASATGAAAARAAAALPTDNAPLAIATPKWRLPYRVHDDDEE